MFNVTGGNGLLKAECAIRRVRRGQHGLHGLLQLIMVVVDGRLHLGLVCLEALFDLRLQGRHDIISDF